MSASCGAAVTDEEAEALRRAATLPDILSGEYDEARDRRLYQPLLRRGLLSREERPHPTESDFEIVHYETTELGKYVLWLHDKTAKVERRDAGGSR